MISDLGAAWELSQPIVKRRFLVEVEDYIYKTAALPHINSYTELLRMEAFRALLLFLFCLSEAEAMPADVQFQVGVNHQENQGTEFGMSINVQNHRPGTEIPGKEADACTKC